MQNIIISELLTLTGELLVGYLVLAYLYTRSKFPRSSKIFWGFIFILIAGLMTLSVDLAIRDLKLFESVMNISTQTAEQQFSVVVSSLYSLIKFIIPFFFAAVGAGLITNALTDKKKEKDDES